jgi:hypothetical protein
VTKPIRYLPTDDATTLLIRLAEASSPPGRFQVVGVVEDLGVD